MMIKSHIRSSVFLLVCLSILLSFTSVSCASDSRWKGEYYYEEGYGKTAGGTGMFLKYVVSIEEGKCEIVLTGYQTHEVILCDAIPENDILKLNFKSYGSGEVMNPYGVKIYEVGERLLDFERRTKSGEMLTHWFSLSTLDETERDTGVYFKKDDAMKE